MYDSINSLPSPLLSLALQSAGQSSTPPAPTGIIGLIILLVCINRRKQEIGGWLLYYYIQLYLGLIFALIMLAFFWHNYLPSIWAARPDLYPLFLLSAVPGTVILVVQLVFAERLRLSRDYRHVHTLRLILWVDLAAVIVATVIDSNFFKDNLIFDFLAFIWPIIWLPYFYISKRVNRVFRTKDWLPIPPPTAAT